MAKADEHGMWHLVMFDLPVKTKQQRTQARQFRDLLLDLGWQMAQYSVYVKYVPTGMSLVPEIKLLKLGLPPQGRVEIVAVTDRQWAKAVRFVNAVEDAPTAPVELLTLF